MDEGYKIARQLELAKAEIAYHIRVFGDFIAHREGYKRHSGIEAVHYFLVLKHGWLPRVVQSLSSDDLEFLLAEDMSNWTLPAEAKTRS